MTYHSTKSAVALAALALVSLAGCSKKGSLQVEAGGAEQAAGAGGRSKSLFATESAADDAKCAGRESKYEISEYDTSGDDRPDVRKVFLRVGEGTLARLVLVCRESDLNADGVKDIVRYYTEEGRPLREEADRNFDGRMDEATIFQEGKILRQEFDYNADAKVDTKVYFDAGKPLRAERDLTGRSTNDRWQPDRWEYFEEGRVVRMGTDLDGDGKVDRWDRDANLRRGPDLSNAPSTGGDSTTDGSAPATDPA